MNIQNVALQYADYVILAVFIAFSSAFFISKGYSNTDIGLILSIVNIGSLFLSPVVANYADTSQKYNVIQILLMLTLFSMIFIVPLYVIDHKSIILSVSFIIVMIVVYASLPLFNTVGFKMEEYGVKSNYGFARAFGSMSYAISSALIGNIVNKYGGNAVSVCGFTASLLMVLLLVWTNHTFKNNEKIVELQKEDKEPIKLLDFIKHHKDLFILCIAYALILFTPNIIENFLIQVITPVGGTNKDVGYLTFMWAMLEIPTMLAFNLIKRKFKIEKLLIFAAIIYLLKVILLYLANSMTLVYIALSFQWCSFALYCPAMVEYINGKVNKDEEVRGQALSSTVNSVFMIFESTIIGVLLDNIGPKPLFLLGIIATALGLVILVFVFKKLDK